MKALPKRKGNFPPEFLQELQGSSGRLNESPSEKEGKSPQPFLPLANSSALNESPSEKEGKSREQTQALVVNSLNESPSEKEGKSGDTPNSTESLASPQ